jgi:hypothetical protein
VYVALATVLSVDPLFDPTARIVVVAATDTVVEYVVPWVHVPAPSAVGVVPSVV